MSDFTHDIKVQKPTEYSPAIEGPFKRPTDWALICAVAALLNSLALTVFFLAAIFGGLL